MGGELSNSGPQPNGISNSPAFELTFVLFIAVIAACETVSRKAIV